MRLVVVSNRVAVPRRRANASQGGLAVGLLAALRENGGLWFGWNGHVDDESDHKVETVTDEQVSYATMPLSRRELQDYYSGFANRMLWPLFHYRPDLVKFRRGQYEAYMRVNTLFARRLLPLLKKDDLIWIHDYHLIPLAAALRQEGAKNPLGFFLHVPFPSPDVMRILPVHQQLMTTLLSYDVIGFQTQMDCDAFLANAEICFPDAHVLRNGIEFGGRRITVGVFPIGIDVEGVTRSASTGRAGAHGRRLAASLASRRLIIGVDRLDYSKGLPDRFSAFGRLLETWPDFRRQVVLLQIAPVSRAEVPEYDLIRRELNEIAGHINGRYAEYDWLPLRYMNRGFPHSAIMGFLAMAQVGFITPLRDGMNLVAKEYVAAQDPDNPGALVLSKLAGAAQELTDAILVNPYDRDETAAGLATALSMPVNERRIRWERMMSQLRKADIHHWVRSFTDALRATGKQRP